MDEKDIQTYNTILAVEGAKKTAELGKEVVEDVIRPSSKSIGDNLGLLIDGVFGWLGLWGQKQKLKQKKNLEEFKQTMLNNIEQIPQDNLKEPTMYIVGPAIEASKFYFEESYFKEMFAKLIAGSCDSRLSEKISPYFVEAIKQMSQRDAKILVSFKKNKQQPIVNYRFKLKNKEGEIDYYTNVYFLDGSEPFPDSNAAYLFNLERLGFITIDFSRHFLDKNAYSQFSNHSLFLSAKKEIEDSINNPDFLYKDITIQEGIIHLTKLGANFIDICL